MEYFPRFLRRWAKGKHRIADRSSLATARSSRGHRDSDNGVRAQLSNEEGVSGGA